MLVYVFGLVSFALVSFGMFFLRKTKFDYSKIKKIFALVAAGLFAVRYMSYEEFQLSSEFETLFDVTKPGAGPSAPILNVLGNILIWLEIAGFLMVVLEPFFESKCVKFVAMYAGAPLILLSFMGMPMMYLMMNSNQNMSFTFVMFGLEMGSLLGLALMNWHFEYKTKFYAPTIRKGILTSIGLIVAAVPTFLMRSFFGYAPASWTVIDMSMTHRLVIYVLILIPPFIIYFALRHQSASFIRYTLLAITLAVMIIFVAHTKIDAFFEPWRWPIHLCNTVLFVMPICFIFKPKRLFYFTYFINVFGAMFALLMPNYSETSNLLEPNLWRFWYNHAIAFWMPLIAVALKVYEKPKLKQYFYSTIWLAVYFVFALSCNVIFSAFDGAQFTIFGKVHTVGSTDFFFLNTDFVAKKLGTLGKNVFNMDASFEVGGRTLTFHPLFQVIYFVTYFLLGFGMWFIYVIFYQISERHYELQLKLREIKFEKLALESKLDGRSIEEPMDKNAGVCLTLEDFSKKYGQNKHYSVHNANLEVHGGEVFGFLGHNGAGKSTIIKSVVGILPIKEGEIEVCGYSVKSQPVQAKALIGYVPDHYALYEKLTAREYLNYIADIYEVSQEDRDARLKEYVELFELEHAIDNQIKTYSHGMKQKVTIIAALIHNPKLWILDEPLTGLDPASIFQVKECMRKHAAKGNIVFFSSHMIDIVEKLCDRIAVIKKGEIQAVKTVEEIEKSGTSLEQFYLDTIGDMKN